ncbi:LysE family translocator [Algirhabdus cladophorae]|uniref:LysE family translocator n=1 Tax=Algirhabdus cladophorae TaxID=3377108 RepID=UPI003B849919
MSFEAWLIFALFWIVFVTTPGPNAVNCIQQGLSVGFRKSLLCVAAILTQASAFLILSAFGVTALILASPKAFFVLQIVGALFLIVLGIRGWMSAKTAVAVEDRGGRSIYFQALSIATLNAKSVAGYLAAFSQFVEPQTPVWDQMAVIMPTALSLTALSYISYCAIGAGLGKLAIGAVLNTWFRRTMALCFVIYGALLGGAVLQGKLR